MSDLKISIKPQHFNKEPTPKYIMSFIYWIFPTQSYKTILHIYLDRKQHTQPLSSLCHPWPIPDPFQEKIGWHILCLDFGNLGWEVIWWKHTARLWIDLKRLTCLHNLLLGLLLKELLILKLKQWNWAYDNSK